MVTPLPSRRSVQRCPETKKKVLSWTTGPPSVPPNWFSVRNGEEENSCLSRLLREFRRLSLWNQNAEPWNSLLPDLVMTFTTDPEATPYWAVN